MGNHAVWQLSAYSNSFFAILAVALLFLAFEAISVKQSPIETEIDIYSSNSLGFAQADFSQVFAVGCIGLMVVGSLISIQIRHEQNTKTHVRR